MGLTVLGQYSKGLVQCEAALGEPIQDQIERLKWSLWHGQVDKALGKIDDLETSIEPFSETYVRYPQLVKALSKLRTYIVNNRHLIPNYGERYRKGEAIATGFVESTVNEVVSKRFCKRQQMQWSKERAPLLLQTRVRVLNGELAASSSAGIRTWILRPRRCRPRPDPQHLHALVEKYRPRVRKPPSPTWRAFLADHVKEIVACDFFTVPTVQCRVLFVFIMLAHERRRIVHFNITEHSTTQWGSVANCMLS
jgi:hypothetical protein